MKYAYGITGIIGAIAAVAAGFFGMPDVMFTSAALAALLLIVGNADRVARVKASMSGVEAETRAVIDEARATIEQLRLVGKLAIQASLSLVMRSGRFGGFSYDEKERIRSVALDAIERLGVSSADRDEMFKDWHTVTRFDYVHFLLGRNTIPEKIRGKPELEVEWQALRHGGFTKIPSPETVEQFLRKAEMLDDETQRLLEDYRHYEEHRQHRRPDAWKALVK